MDEVIMYVCGFDDVRGNMYFDDDVISKKWVIGREIKLNHEIQVLTVYGVGGRILKGVQNMFLNMKHV